MWLLLFLFEEFLCHLETIYHYEQTFPSLYHNDDAYRFDIFGPMDLVEEVALGYGIQNFEPTVSPSQTIGQTNPVSLHLKSLNQTMIGLGFLEALNSSLSSKRVLYEMTNRDSKNIISVLDSKSQEHTILRDTILPGLLENLSRNIHESYPQKLFEIYLNSKRQI